MAETTNLAPSRRRSTAAGSSSSTPAAASVGGNTREAQLEAQIAQLQTDLKAIATTLSRLTGEKVDEVKDIAKGELRHLRRQGQHVVDDMQDQASVMEKQLKDTIREKPLTAVASAIGIGYILALLTRH